MNLSKEQKQFAYGKYVFNNRIESILDFMDPVSKLDVKIEEVKGSSGSVEFSVFFILAIVVAIVYYAKDWIAKTLNTNPSVVTSIMIPSIIGCFVFYFVIYGIYYYRHINKDVDNDLNNFIIPFLKQINKYIDKSTPIKLITDLSSKLNRKNKIPTGAYADTLVLPWFSGEFLFDNGIKVFVDLTYVIDCYGKLEIIHSGKDFKELNMKAEIRFVFPKKPSFNRFDYLGAKYILDWSESENEYSLKIKTVEKCDVEFYRESDKTLGLLFDKNFCIDIIDEVYAKITGFTGYLMFKSNEYQAQAEDEIENNEPDDLEDSLEEIKNQNEEFHKKEAMDYTEMEMQESDSNSSE